MNISGLLTRTAGRGYLATLTFSLSLSSLLSLQDSLLAGNKKAQQEDGCNAALVKLDPRLLVHARS